MLKQLKVERTKRYLKSNVLVEMFEDAGFGTWIWRLQSNELLLSKRALNLLELESFDNSLESFQKIVKTDDLEDVLSGLSFPLLERRSYSSRFRVVRPFGDFKWLYGYGKPIYGPRQTLKQVIGYFSECNDDHRALETLARFGTQTKVENQSVDIEMLKVVQEELKRILKQNNRDRTVGLEVRLLVFVITRFDPLDAARCIARRLFTRFHRLVEIVLAPREELLRVAGVREEHCVAFAIIGLAIQTLLGPSTAPIVMDNLDKLLLYLRAKQAYNRTEQLRVVFLDKRNHILTEEVMSDGSIDSVYVCQRTIIKRALDLYASAIVLVHNHPSGDPTPSTADVELTRRICQAAQMFNIVVQDHIILGRHGHISLKKRGMMPIVPLM